MARMQTTTGTVVKSEIGTTLSGTQGSSIQFPDVTYQYTVNGQTYLNNRVTQQAIRSSFGSVVQRTLDQYPVGSTVTVHYNVDNPQDAYLEKGLGRSTLPIIVLVVAIVAISIAFAVFMIQVTS